MYTKTVPYDVVLALKNLDDFHRTKNAVGDKGHAKTCSYSNTADASSTSATGVSVTLVIDTGVKNSYGLLGYGKSPKNDLSTRIGVPSEKNPANTRPCSACASQCRPA